MKHIEVEVAAAAEPDDVWSLLAEVSTWPEWAAFDSAMVESGHGAGEIRRFRRGRWVTVERVTGFEPHRRLSYALVSGLPVRDYEAEVSLTSTACGTTIRWNSSFAATVPGTGGLIQRGLKRFIEDTAQGLALAAEARSAKRERELEGSTSS